MGLLLVSTFDLKKICLVQQMSDKKIENAGWKRSIYIIYRSDERIKKISEILQNKNDKFFY